HQGPDGPDARRGVGGRQDPDEDRHGRHVQGGGQPAGDALKGASRGASSSRTGSSIGGVDSTPPIVWTPSPDRIASATITRYREWLNDTYGLALDDYAELWQWSVDELEAFWASIWEFFRVEASEPYERVLTTHAMPGARWFPGARLSY